MDCAPQLLLVANSEDERLLYARTLLREFPAAAVTECTLAGATLLVWRERHFDAVVIHFDGTPEAKGLVETLRRQSRTRPIIALSGIDRTIDAIAAGVTRFLPAENWRDIGAVLSGLLTSTAMADVARSGER